MYDLELLSNSITLIVAVLNLVGFAMIFKKAGEKPWKALIPIYNMVVFCKIVNMTPWLVLMYLVPFLDIVFLGIMYYRLSNCFGHGIGFFLGLLFLPPIFNLILGFSEDEYRQIERI